MSLSPDEVRRIAHLARIQVSESDTLRTQAELNDIFGLIERMQAVDTVGVEPMCHAQDLILRLRQDEVSESDQRNRFQSVAPQVEAGLYLVPKVIE